MEDEDKDEDERWIDNGTYVFDLFMDRSVAFDAITHDLMLAKLKAH